MKHPSPGLDNSLGCHASAARGRAAASRVQSDSGTRALSGRWRMPGMRLALRWLVVESVMTVMLAGLSAPVASAAVPLGGGAGIAVGDTYCTLTTIGHDNTGELVGFTAARCGGPGAQVVAEGTDVTVGTVVVANGSLNYAVIKFDPAAVTPVHDFAGFAINGIGPDPAPNQPVCKQGGATGNDCGHTSPLLNSRPDHPTSRIAASWQPGDDGSPITSNDLLVAMVYDGFILPATGPFIVGHPEQPESRVIMFSAILNDVDANGGSGAGFTPVPA